MKTLADQIRDLENTRAVKMSRMEKIPQKSFEEGRSMDEAEKEEFDTVEQEIKQIDEELVRLNRLQKMMAVSAKPVDPDPKPTDKGLGKPKSPAILQGKSDADEKFQGQHFTRVVIAKALARLDGMNAISYAQHRWGKSCPQLVEYIKADVSGLNVDASGSGAEWVVDVPYMGDFIEFLNGRTVYNQLPLREVPANITIGAQSGAATGYWVGDGKAIPVSKPGTNNVSLAPLKVAALAVCEKEWLRDSNWSAEMLVRDALIEALAQRIDTTFISNTAAVANVSPAGILNGIDPTNSAGTDGDSVRNDIKEMLYDFLTAKNSIGLHHVMSPTLATSLQLLRNALDQDEFPNVTEMGGNILGRPLITGDNVNANYHVILKPSDIYRIGAGTVEVSLSDQASIEMATNPGQDTSGPTAATQKVVSMFQTEAVAFKVVQPMNFQTRRSSGVVAWIDDADYGGAIST